MNNYPGIHVELKIYDLDSREIYNESVVADSRANSSVKCFVPAIPSDMPPVYMVRMRTFSSSGLLLSENTYFKTPNGKKDFRALAGLKPVNIKGKLISRKTSGKLETFNFSVTNSTKVMAVSIKLNVRDSKTGKRVLPAYISDGYFTLLPGETKVIQADCQTDNLPALVKISAEGSNVPLQDIIR